MHDKYLHNHAEFPDLLNIIADEMGVLAGLVEKDYWIMHVLYGLQANGFDFELKGGTSLSKGYKIIDRFSEDIDIHIKPPVEFCINENPKNINPKNVQARKEYYDWLASSIHIAGIVSVERDTHFDDTTYYRSGGIRLDYDSHTEKVSGLKEGILLEVGFDTVTPNKNITISSWAYDRAVPKMVDIIDNRAFDIKCYHVGYTFVEKLQTIATKFRREQTEQKGQQNFMRQYYDVYRLLSNEEVIKFIGSAEYHRHKAIRFPKADFEVPISKNEAFLLSARELRSSFEKRYQETAALYYKGQPSFEEILARIGQYIDRL